MTLQKLSVGSTNKNRYLKYHFPNYKTQGHKSQSQKHRKSRALLSLLTPYYFLFPSFSLASSLSLVFLSDVSINKKLTTKECSKLQRLKEARGSGLVISDVYNCT